MSSDKKNADKKDLIKRLEADLFVAYGPMVSGEFLRKALGFPSLAAMRQAVARGVLPIPIFSIKYRRGKFALVKDIAPWLAEQRSHAAIIQKSDLENKGLTGGKKNDLV